MCSWFETADSTRAALTLDIVVVWCIKRPVLSRCLSLMPVAALCFQRWCWVESFLHIFNKAFHHSIIFEPHECIKCEWQICISDASIENVTYLPFGQTRSLFWWFLDSRVMPSFGHLGNPSGNPNLIETTIVTVKQHVSDISSRSSRSSWVQTPNDWALFHFLSHTHLMFGFIGVRWERVRWWHCYK